MTIQYKNKGFSLANTNLTTVLSISTSAVAILKSITLSNTSSGSITASLKLRDSSATTDFRFYEKVLATKTTEVVTNINLEAGDSLKAQSTQANAVEGVVSYALLDRSQENG